MTRLRFLLRLNPSKLEAGNLASYGNVTFAPMEALSEGLGGLDLSLEKPADELADGSYSYFAEGDLLLAKVTPCFENGKKALVAKLPNRIGFATSEVHVVRPNPARVDPNYLRYLFSSDTFLNNGIASMSGAGGLQRVSENAIKDFVLPIEDLRSQRAVASFLDQETARIDGLIAKKLRFQTVLEAKRKALTAAVVDGSLLHSDKRTGGEGWFGRLPSHWKVRRARFLFREHIDPSQDGSEELLTVSHITGVTARAGKDVNMFLAATLEGYKIVQPSDLVVNTMWAWMGAIGVSPIAGCASPSYAVYRPKRGVFRSDYLDLIVRSQPFVSEVNRRSKGVWASRLRLYPDAFLDIPFPVPPLDEQERLVTTLNAKMHREELIAARATRSVALLKERRLALITAAVTGKVDVPESLPTFVADRTQFRVLVAAEAIHRHRNSQKFGRVKLQKVLFLVEAHAGIGELRGNYLREAAGPLDRSLIEETERVLQAKHYYRTHQPEGAGTYVSYVSLSQAGQHGADLERLLGPRVDGVRKLIDLLRDLSKDGVEAVATLYAVWNDALIDGESPEDAAIIRCVLTEWHREKREKFRSADLERWLDWMKRQSLTPTGTGPRTVSTMTRDMFS